MAVTSVMRISMVVASELAVVGSPDSQCFTSRGISVPLLLFSVTVHLHSYHLPRL